MQDINWNDVRVFHAVAQAGQIASAAQALRLDPTTLSRRLRRLERALEATLFERTREGLALTEAGEMLLTKAETMAGAAGSIAETLGPHQGLSGTLRISVAEGFGSQFLTRELGAFCDAHPNLTIDLVASSGFLNLSRREADIAVMLSRPARGPVLAQKLADYRLRLYASEDYLAARGKPANPVALAEGHALIGYVPDLVYAPELDYLGEFHGGLAARLRSSSINAQVRLVREGAGIAVLPCFMADCVTGLVPVCADRSILRTLWLVTHHETRTLARVQAGKDWLRQTVDAGRDRLLPRA